MQWPEVLQSTHANVPEAAVGRLPLMKYFEGVPLDVFLGCKVFETLSAEGCSHRLVQLSLVRHCCLRVGLEELSASIILHFGALVQITVENQCWTTIWKTKRMQNAVSSSSLSSSIGSTKCIGNVRVFAFMFSCLCDWLPLSVGLSVCLSVLLCVCLSVCLSVSLPSLFVSLSVCLSVQGPF
jgi:hypothetical protein